jgi:hypothetical protein
LSPYVRTPPYTYQHQADAAISQADPVSTTLYEVLATTSNVRIISIEAHISFAAGAPDPLEVVVTIDGQTTIFIRATPATATAYYAKPGEDRDPANQELSATEYAMYRAFLLEGRSVRVQIRVTWAVNQPTPLVCRVKYAKIP